MAIAFTFREIACNLSVIYRIRATDADYTDQLYQSAEVVKESVQRCTDSPIPNFGTTLYQSHSKIFLVVGTTLY